MLSVCFYVLFSPLHTVHASDYEPDYYIRDEECTFSSGIRYAGSTEVDFSLDFVSSTYLGVGHLPGSHLGVVWQNLDRTIPSGIYDVVIKVKFVGASTPDYFDFTKVKLGYRHWDNGYILDAFADSIDYLPAQNGNEAYLTFTFKNNNVPGDFNRLTYDLYYTTTLADGDGGADLKLEFTSVSLSKVDQTPGLLKNIVDVVKNIWTGITELPSKIIDGIKNLFIPSEEDITNMKDKWDTLLSDRFGALYQVVDLISDYAAAFKEQSKNTITFPSISIPLAGATFEFGGWEVQVIPDGFDTLINALKLIISIVCTFLFINGLKNRFDKILGGADDI